jgi:C4-dicarboxylate transporter DctM subunit
MIWAIVGMFAGLIAFGVPVAYSLGLATTIGLAFGSDIPLFVVAHKMVTGIDSFVLLAVPLYILAGALMETGGMAARLVSLAMVIVGWIRGGLAMAVVVVEYLFSGLSGATVADVSAVGSICIPSMVRASYRAAYAVAVVSAASAMGMLVPPCINMVVAGAIANISVGALFIGGFVPAIVLAICILVLIYWQARKFGWKAEEKVTPRKFVSAWGGALVPLGMPIIIFGGIIGGIVTPTEAGMLAVAYALVVGVILYREIRIRDLYKILLNAAVTSGVIGVLVGIASVFAWMMAAQKIPQTILEGMLSVSTAPVVFLLMSAVIFLVIGSFLEGLPAIVVLLPTMFPVIEKLGIHPIHYVNVIIAATGIGLFLPPIGLGLLISCSIARVDVTSAARALSPFLIMLLVGLVIVILFPSITLFLPRMVGLIH